MLVLVYQNFSSRWNFFSTVTTRTHSHYWISVIFHRKFELYTGLSHSFWRWVRFYQWFLVLKFYLIWKNCQIIIFNCVREFSSIFWLCYFISLTLDSDDGSWILFQTNIEFFIVWGIFSNVVLSPIPRIEGVNIYKNILTV